MLSYLRTKKKLLQAYSKIFGTLIFKNEFQKNIRVLDRLFFNSNGAYRNVFHTWTKIIFIITKSLLVLYIMSVFIFATIPLVYYILYGKLQLAIEIIIPFVNPHTTNGFFINLIYQIYGFLFACAGMSGIDGMFIFFSFQGLALLTTTIISFREFSKIAVNDVIVKNPYLIKRYFRDVVERYYLMQEFVFEFYVYSYQKLQQIIQVCCCRYVNDMSDAFALTNLIHVASSSLSLALCLFISTVVGYETRNILYLRHVYFQSKFLFTGHMVDR